MLLPGFPRPCPPCPPSPSLPADLLRDQTQQRENEEEQGQRLVSLLDRLLEVAECDPDLYTVLPWLRSVSLWELLLKRKAEARFSYVSCFSPSSPSSHSSDTLSTQSTLNTATTLLTFFARVTQPVAEMAEALYLSPLLWDIRTVWEILRRMARAARVDKVDGASGIKPLPRAVVVALCASLTRSRLIVRGGCEPRPHPAIWKITWQRIPVRLQWSVQSPVPDAPDAPGATRVVGNSLLVLVREEITHKAGIGSQQSRKVLAFRCMPDPLDRRDLGPASRPCKITEYIQAEMKLALYDALVFSRSRKGDSDRPINPPTLLRVQSPVPGAPLPKAIREAASVWGIKVEEAEAEAEVQRELEGVDHVNNYAEWNHQPEWEKWEKELAGQVLDPVHYMRILDRGLERTYGYAPFLTKQRVICHQGWRWRMLPNNDPARNYTGLRELLQSYPAVVGDDGTVEWRGFHYRDYEEDVLRYFPGEQVTVRPSPLAEAAILVYWRGSILCYAVAEELRHEDGSYRPYWFPYPRLGE